MSKITPTAAKLSPIYAGINSSGRRSPGALAAKLERALENKAKWFLETADRIVLPFTLEDLAKGRKKFKVAQLEAECRRLESQDAHVMSAIFEGSDGVPILAYCSNRLLEDGVAPRRLDIDNQYSGRTAADLEARVKEAKSKSNGREVLTFDGVPDNHLRNFHLGTQTMASASRGHTKKDLQRHGYQTSMDYQAFVPSEQTDGQSCSISDSEELPGDVDTLDVVNPDAHQTLETSSEDARLVHLVHGWKQQGHKNGGLYVSKDLVRSSTSYAVSKSYYTATAGATAHIATYHQAVFPTWHQDYAMAFSAGQMFSEDPGPFLGRALIYKLQSKLHKDRRDAGTSVSFGSGHYSGGEFYVPQLKAKFRYDPGSFCIFFSSLLYHKVGHWEPLPQTKKMEEEKITPGRLATVFFFPQESLNNLANKPPGWAVSSGMGYNPSLAETEELPKPHWELEEGEIDDLMMDR